MYGKNQKSNYYMDIIKNPEYYPDEEESWDSNKKAYDLFYSIWNGRWGIW